MDRVYIVGGGGSGKTTLARHLASLSNVTPVELDLDPYADRAALAAGERWVVEGIFLFGIGPLLERADVIVWLDLPRSTALRRIVVRHAWLSLRRRNRYSGVRLLWEFVLSQARYYTAPAREPTAADDWDALTRALTVERVAAHSDRVVHLRTARSVRRFRRRFNPMVPGLGHLTRH